MPIEKTCENCQGLFRVKPAKATQVYCSGACKTAFERTHGRPAARVGLIEFACKKCSAPFFHNPSNLRAYQKKWGKDPTYCSIKCAATGRKITTELRHAFTCEHCGKEHFKRRKPGGRIYAQQKYCSYECKNAGLKTKALTRFNDVPLKRYIKSRNGYAYVSVPSLASTRGKKSSVAEHRYVMSKHIGRDLFPEETVHHINGDRTNNDISNLELFSSRHGPGQRVVDKVNFAIDMLRLYPEIARAAGVELQEIPHVSDSPASHEVHRAQACP